jgi:hypothetical protein
MSFWLCQWLYRLHSSLPVSGARELSAEGLCPAFSRQVWQLIYEAKGYDNGSKTFGGHSNKNGQMQLPGTYFYQLDYMVNGITKHKTGFIVLKY